MIGFLGTVTGMVQAFWEMSNAGNNIDITLLSGGIYEAMITTVGGLVVGIAAMFAYNYLVTRVDKVVKSNGSAYHGLHGFTERTRSKVKRMALKRRHKISPNFSMASMTDIIFLLLIFFMITSTMVSPNAIKVLLPQGRQQTSAKPLTRVIIDKNLNFYTAFGNEDEMPIDLGRTARIPAKVCRREGTRYVCGSLCG